ncbi:MULTISPECIES: type VI secretion protein [unclassified Brevundimonas]|uniref:type VI secretion protein n=1 Tax=unclassified Brevundimonas TaxID=2622653 RepID=UPI0025C5EA0A|nr:MULTISPECIES: type VI secretion protein [unclassified Brevundimonas]
MRKPRDYDAELKALGAGEDGERAAFFGPVREGVDATGATEGWTKDRHHFRFIISPEHGDRILDLQGFTREVMSRVADDLGEPGLNWIAVCHFDTDQPHAHVLVRGRRSDGRDLVIPRDYIGYGFRARAQEVAQERLGDLSRQDAERRVWRETEADRFTALDRRLLAAADTNVCVDDGIGGADAWTALTRGRLRHLERLGLAIRAGRRFQLSIDLEAKLRRLQLSKDVIRTLNQRRLEGARSTEHDEPPLGLTLLTRLGVGELEEAIGGDQAAGDAVEGSTVGSDVEHGSSLRRLPGPRRHNQLRTVGAPGDDGRPVADTDRGHGAEIRHAPGEDETVAGPVEGLDDLVDRQDELILVAHAGPRL